MAQRIPESVDCQACDLPDENERLREELEELRKMLQRWEQVIEQVRDYTLTTYNEAQRVMSRHQPRGTWSLWKGKGEVAREVYNMLLEVGR